MWVALMVLLVSQALPGGTDDWVSKCPTTCRCVWSEGKKTADCQNSNFTSVPKTLSSSLQTLKLNDNHLGQINAGDFVAVPNLHKLYLRNTGLSKIHPDSLSTLKVLIEIDLSNNNIHELHPQLFRMCERIREVTIQRNPIHRLEAGLFNNLVFLQNVDFSYCEISSVSVNAFVNVPIVTLELRGNKLSYLDTEIFTKNLTKLRQFGITNNPWQCDCRLRPLRNAVIERNWFTKPTTCANLNDRQWNDVDETEFACAPTLSTAFRDGHLFACSAHGDPEPSIEWLSNNKPIRNNSFSASYVFQSGNGWLNMTVRGGRSQDSGRYKCVARNAAGFVESDIIKVEFLTEYEDSFGSTAAVYEMWPLIIGVVMGALLLLLIVLILVCFMCNKQRRVATKKDMRDLNGIPSVDTADEKSLISSVNPVQKPPRRQETAFTSETELLETSSLPYNENGSIPGSIDTQTTAPATLGRSRSRDATDPPDLLSFGQLGSPQSLVTLGSPGNRNPLYSTLPYARSHSPFSQPAVVSRSGYVTLSRKPRTPSWTGNLSPVPVSPEEAIEPVYDSCGPRTTATGSSLLSLNKIDNRWQLSDRQRPNYTPEPTDEREMLIAGSPIATVTPRRIPPNPPPKPKKRKNIYQDEGEDGTEV